MSTKAWYCARCVWSLASLTPRPAIHELLDRNRLPLSSTAFIRFEGQGCPPVEHHMILVIQELGLYMDMFEELPECLPHLD